MFGRRGETLGALGWARLSIWLIEGPRKLVPGPFESAGTGRRSAMDCRRALATARASDRTCDEAFAMDKSWKFPSTCSVSTSATAPWPDACRGSRGLCLAQPHPRTHRADWLRPAACVTACGIARPAAISPLTTPTAGLDADTRTESGRCFRGAIAVSESGFLLLSSEGETAA